MNVLHRNRPVTRRSIEIGRASGIGVGFSGFISFKPVQRFHNSSIYYATFFLMKLKMEIEGLMGRGSV